MEVTTRRSILFEAAHTLDRDPDCGLRQHGHSWAVEVMITHRDVDPHTGHLSVDALTALREIRAEFNNMNLNEMLPGLPPTAEHLARYLAERLRMPLSGLSAVTVRMGTIYEATVRL